MTARVRKKLEDNRLARLLFSPALLWLLIFFVAPLLIALVVSLARRGPYGATVYDLTGDNYLRALDRPLPARVLAEPVGRNRDYHHHGGRELSRRLLHRAPSAREDGAEFCSS